MCLSFINNKTCFIIEDISSLLTENGIPDEYLCPITREIMREPVIAAGTCCHLALLK